MSIRFQEVSHDYVGINKKEIFHAMKDINLEIPNKGEFICVIGRTGSGKSTLISHMNALLIPSKGTVTIDDKVITSSPRKNKKLNDVRRKVGMVFQFPEYQLFEETILKDVMFGPKNFGLSEEEAKKEAIHALTLVGMDKSMYEKSPLNLSGGQMRRVAIAGTLAMKPEILILDEPTRGLDPMAAEQTMNLFLSIQKKTNQTMIMITHDMNIVYEYATRVIVMQNGSIVYDGDKYTLFQNNYKEYSLERPEVLEAMDYIEKNSNIQFDKEKIFNYEQLLQALKG